MFTETNEMNETYLDLNMTSRHLFKDEILADVSFRPTDHSLTSIPENLSPLNDKNLTHLQNFNRRTNIKPVTLKHSQNHR